MLDWLATRDALLGRPSFHEQYCRAKLTLPKAELDPPPLLTGDDLINAGHRPGKAFAATLQTIRAAQLDGKLDSTAAALDMAARGFYNSKCALSLVSNTKLESENDVVI